MRRAELRHPSGPLPRRLAHHLAHHLAHPLAPRLPAAAAAVVLGLVIGCSGARANSHYRYPREVSYGRTSTCPDVRLPPLRDGGVSPDAARCSFADANGARVTHLAGKVLAEGGPGDPGVGVSGVKVTAHRLRGSLFDPATPGPLIAHANTDAQGNYSLRGVFVPAEYALVVHEPTGETITYRVVRVEPEALNEVRDVHVLIPVDPRLKAEAAPPPTPRADARLRAPAAPNPTPATAPATAPNPTPATAPATAPATSVPPATPATPATAPRPPPAGIRMRPPE